MHYTLSEIRRGIAVLCATVPSDDYLLNFFINFLQANEDTMYDWLNADTEEDDWQGDFA